MCDGRAGSGWRATPRPRWGLLYGLMALALAALAAVEVAASSGVSRTVLEAGLAAGLFTTMALWARLNRAALDLQASCDCAAAKMTVRVITSPRRDTLALEAPPLDRWIEEQEEAWGATSARR